MSRYLQPYKLKRLYELDVVLSRSDERLLWFFLQYTINVFISIIKLIFTQTGGESHGFNNSLSAGWWPCSLYKFRMNNLYIDNFGWKLSPTLGPLRLGRLDSLAVTWGVYVCIIVLKRTGYLMVLTVSRNKFNFSVVRVDIPVISVNILLCCPYFRLSAVWQYFEDVCHVFLQFL